MATFDKHPPGTPCWVDLMTPDTAASGAFYTAVFGWDIERELDDEGNEIYHMFQQGGLNVAGMGGQPPEMQGAPPMWNSYVAVDDPAETVAKAEQAGGSIIMPPMQVMSAGEMAVFADPAGAVISIWKPIEHLGAQICNEPDTYSWNELMTRDIDAALPFYAAVFGWDYDAQDMGPMGTYHVIQGGENGGLGGLMAMPAEMPDQVPNHWAVYFTVADCSASLDKAKAAGGGAMNEPMAVPGVGTMVNIHDPLGGNFNIIQPETA